MRKNMLAITGCLLAATVWAENIHPEPKDTTKVIDIEEVVVIASPKETGKPRELPASVSLLSQKDMQTNRITSLKNISSLVPNFFMPDYGSRLTSAIYIRGIGSRINTPAVGLYVDNIPYIDKSAFDFNFYDIERIDILRGPQGTLYGRNTMGGLIKVHTRSPFFYQGTDVKLSYGSKSNYYSASLTHYHRWNDRFAFSAGGYYEGSDGFFRNAFNGKKIDKMKAGGGRMRAIWLPSENLKLDYSIGYDYSDEGGYPYYYTKPEEGYESENEKYKDHIGKISYDQDCSYRRGLFNTGLNLEYQAQKFTVNAVTGFQNLNDRMFLDQDFLPTSIYTIEQKQRLNNLSEEITLKSKNNKHWQWVTGVSGFYQWLHTNGPVDFMKNGVDEMIEGNVNTIFKKIHQSNPRAPEMSLDVLNSSVRVGGIFDTPIFCTALFHQSTFNNLFVKGLSMIAGLRMEYENMSMNYFSDSHIDFDFFLKMATPPFQIPFKELKALPLLKGKEKNDYVQLLPKLAFKYDLGSAGNLYASIAKGYRSGGYNVQMFSELIQSDMQQKMIKAILDKTPEAMKGMIEGMIQQHLPNYGKELNVKETTVYKPEYSWNYEAGAHLNLFNGKLKADLAAFYMDTHDQQIAKFVNSGLGRMMVNAGSSESYGIEASLLASISRNLSMNANYGYTRSTFKKYDGGITSSEEHIDYSGNYVPFVPHHTANAGASYSFFFDGNCRIQSLTIGMNYTGAGKIYWTEKNNASQSFYGTLNSQLSLKAQTLQIDVWGRNLTNKKYTTFYFETMHRGFEQKSRPLQLGVDVRYHF
ncbi:TonB-dependent receptor [Phocaeicola sp.]|uniref:TonB-dependent receptor n=1 Tax=Phocaeicola sp. TaxID=2773926 RepID=UPI0023C3166E|nr:TonB-dependent receptor [Phocaeicola sp.]MDE5678430.1 TonB-dependent receptor [Phocaeicola sp.]